jgi:hypothetical protein
MDSGSKINFRMFLNGPCLRLTASRFPVRGGPIGRSPSHQRDAP